MKYTALKKYSYERQRGSALVIVLLLVVMITTLVVEFAYDIYADTSAASNWTNAQRATLIAKSGLAFSAEYLRSEVKGSHATSTRAITLPVPIDFGSNSQLILSVEDEESKLNINRIEEEKYLNMLKRLLEYLNIDPDVGYAILDWIDKGSEPNLSNSEEHAKDAPLWSVDELKDIEGIDLAIFNKLSPFITVHETGNDIGRGSVNINTAQLPVLISLHAEMTESLAQNIIDYRKATPFKDHAELADLPGMGQIGAGLMGGSIKTNSDLFRISAIATSNEITRIIESVMDTSMDIYYWREG